MGATAFATSDPLDPSELEAAPVRYPRPSRLSAALSLEGAKTRKAAESLGLATVEDLLLHLPRDRREARAVAELVPGDSATVVVQVRSISSRSVRRRGMRPLVEATVADDSGAMKATFFNQPWLEQRYPVGTRLVAARQVRGTSAGSESRLTHGPATRCRAATPGRAAWWLTTRPQRGCPRPRSWRWSPSTRAAFDDVVEPLPALAASARAAARPGDGVDRGPLPRRVRFGLRRRAAPAGVRRAAARAAGAAPPAASAAARRAPRPCSTPSPS